MAQLIVDDHLPAVLTASSMTIEEFSSLSAEHPGLDFERTGEGDLIVTQRRRALTGVRNSDIVIQLATWAQRDGRGFVEDSETVFVLANRAFRTADVAWLEKGKIPDPASGDPTVFVHGCPEFVVLFRTTCDQMTMIRSKMLEYIENGAKLGWLIDPETQSVEIYRPGREPETLANAESVAGEGPVAGFILDLRPVWNPLAA